MCSFDARIRGPTRPPYDEKYELAWGANGNCAPSMRAGKDILAAPPGGDKGKVGRPSLGIGTSREIDCKRSGGGGMKDICQWEGG